MIQLLVAGEVLEAGGAVLVDPEHGWAGQRGALRPIGSERATRRAGEGCPGPWAGRHPQAAVLGRRGHRLGAGRGGAACPSRPRQTRTGTCEPSQQPPQHTPPHRAGLREAAEAQRALTGGRRAAQENLLLRQTAPSCHPWHGTASHNLWIVLRAPVLLAVSCQRWERE